MDDHSGSQHFLEYWRVLRSHKEAVIAVMLFITVAGIIASQFLPRKYLASTRITISPAIADTGVFERRETSGWYNPFFLKTQLEEIQSQRVLDQVIERLNLREEFAKARGASRPLSLREARAELRGCVRAKPYLDTNIIKIEVVRQSNEKGDENVARRDAAKIAEAIARVYEKVSTDDARDKTRTSVRTLEDELRHYTNAVILQQAKVEKIRKDSNLPALGHYREEGSMLERIRLSELEHSRAGMRHIMIEKKAKLDRLDGMLKSKEYYRFLPAIQNLAGVPELLSLRRDRAQRMLKLANLEKSLGEKHPDVMSARAELREIDSEIAEVVEGARIMLQTAYEIAETRFVEIEKDLAAESAADILRASERYVPFYNAKAELMQLRKLRDQIKMRLVEEKIDYEQPRSPVKVIDEPEVPELGEYVSPRHFVNGILSLLIGIVCGVSLAFFREYVDTSVKTIEEIERYVGVPVVGVIARKARPLIETGGGSPHSEAYRILRTNILFSKKLKGGRTICVTSGGAGEGKSLTVANLAYVDAQLGDRVVVIDSDLRRPRQHKVFGLSRHPGLTDVLRGEVDVDAAIQETSMTNLCLLSSGTSTIASAGLLDTQRMGDVMELLKDRFDVLIFDAPPIMGVSDASVLVRKVDAVLLVIQHRNYPRDLSARAKKIVENVGGNLLGVVLNNINLSRDYYSYYSYVGQYAYSMPEEEDSVREDKRIRSG